MHGRKYMALALGFFSTPQKLEFLSPKIFPFPGRGTTLPPRHPFLCWNSPQAMTPETPDKNHAANGAELPRTIHTEHLTCCQFGQVKFHVIFYLQGCRCQDTTTNTNTNTATPDLCDKANGPARMQKSRTGWFVATLQFLLPEKVL